MMKKFNVEELLQTARKRTGLSDFGPPDFMQGLPILIESLNKQSEIRQDSWDHAHERLLRLLMNRLWFAKDMAEHPELINEEIKSPIFITSMPRTGSTKLHRLLGASGDFQTMSMWQAQMFARIPGLPDGGKARRIQETREYEKWMYETSPDILIGHPMFTDEAEEDQVLTEFSFRSPNVDTYFNVPEYSGWRLMQADPKPAYDYFRTQIQYLQWQRNPVNEAPWLLKTPDHFGNEHHLVATFKNPRFIVTHRDPAKCIPSITNAVRFMQKLYSDHETSAAIVDWLFGHYSHMSKLHMQWRDDNPQIQVLDLSFDEISNDGMSAVQKIYEFFEMPLSPAAKSSMKNWEFRNPREKVGKHVYSAAAIGTSDQVIRQTFGPYLERFAKFI